MKAQCVIQLTDEQKKQLESLQDTVVEAYRNGKKGAIIAQVIPNMEGGVMYCVFWSNDIIMKAWKAIGEDPPI